MKDRLAESRDLEPDRSYKDLFRHIGTMWSNLSDIEKEVREAEIFSNIFCSYIL